MYVAKNPLLHPALFKRVRTFSMMCVIGLVGGMLFYSIEVFFATLLQTLYDGDDQVQIGVDSKWSHQFKRREWLTLTSSRHSICDRHEYRWCQRGSLTTSPWAHDWHTCHAVYWRRTTSLVHSSTMYCRPRVVRQSNDLGLLVFRRLWYWCYGAFDNFACSIFCPRWISVSISKRVHFAEAKTQLTSSQWIRLRYSGSV